jgi:hypothetical protein
VGMLQCVCRQPRYERALSANPTDPEVRRVAGASVKVFERDLGCSVEEAHAGFEDPISHSGGVVALELDLRDCGRW